MADRDDIPEPPPPGPVPDVPLRPVAPGRYADFVPVGEGGMGIVYQALDSELNRQVAFKVIRPPGGRGRAGVTPPAPLHLTPPGGGTDEAVALFDQLRARFLQEAWVTGGMEHPGIVPVYELGRTEGGVPYYTMKFVRGQTTLATALAEAPDLQARLELLEVFLKVCDTIRYAHSRGVVHRDLKPANIALGGFGEVIVLDWGLAKLAGARVEGEGPQSRWQGSVRAFRDTTGLATDAGVVGTPGYMAPEAAEGLVDDLDARCDVYGLGVILFELLTGRRPFAFDDVADYVAQVTAGEAPDARSLAPEAPAGLAAVCAQALARRRAERTPSVDALAAAVRSWRARRRVDRELEGLRQEADARLAAAEGTEGDALLRTLDAAALACNRALELRPEDEGARTRLARVEALRTAGIAARERAGRRRLLRRVGAAALVVALTTAAVVAAVLEQRRREAEDARRVAAEARTRALADRARAEGVMGFMVRGMQGSLEPLGRLDLLAQIGREAKAYYAALPPEARTPDSLRNGAIALRNLGDVHRAQGELPEAQAAYEGSRDLALALEEAGAPEAGLHLALARGRLGAVLTAKGYPGHAVAMLRAHVEAMRRHAEHAPGDRALEAALAEACHHLARAERGVFALDASLASSREALEIGQRLAAADDDEGTHHRALVRYLLGPMRALRIRERLDEIDERVTRAEAITARWRVRRPDDARWQALGGRVAMQAGLAALGRARPADAVRHLERARGAWEALRARDPTNLDHTANLAFTLHRLGIALAEGDEPAAAAARPEHELWRRAYALLTTLVAKDPTNAGWMHSMIDLCDRMAAAAKAEGLDALTVERYRGEALTYARRLMECDEQNPLWMHLYAYTLFQHATRRKQLDPAAFRRQLDEVIRLCRTLAPRHPDGLGEVAVLHAWASAALLGQDGRAADDALDEAAFRLLQEAYEKTGDAALRPVLLETGLRLVARLAEGGSAAERTRARARLAVVRAVLAAGGDEPDDDDRRTRAQALHDRLGTGD